MTALLLLAATVISCTVPAINHTQGYFIEPGAFAGFHCDTVDLTNTAPFLIISTDAFSNATGFTELTIPANTRTIEDFAFTNTTVKHVAFLNPLTTVADFAFDDLCSIAVHCPTYYILVDITEDWQTAYRTLAACDVFRV